MISLVFAIILMISSDGYAAIDPVQVKQKKSERYLTTGLFVGGEHQRDVALMDIRRQYSSKAKLERIVLEMKSLAGANKGRASFFQVNVNAPSNRVQIDISGMSGAHLALNEISKLIEKSPLVAKAEFIIDPEDRSAMLNLQLKRTGLKIEAYELTGTDSGRLVIDLKE